MGANRAGGARWAKTFKCVGFSACFARVTSPWNLGTAEELVRLFCLTGFGSISSHFVFRCIMAAGGRGFCPNRTLLMGGTLFLLSAMGCIFGLAGVWFGMRYSRSQFF